ncbi:MAG: ABC transporter permease subunit [Pseudolabrys sp.]
MRHEELRESVPVLTFPRQTLVSLLVFAVVWEVLSHLAPYLGIPPFAIPSFVRIARSITTITPIDIVVTLARVIAALIVSFVLGLALAMAMYRSDSLNKYLHPMIRLLMAVPVVSWILFAVLWFPGVEFRIGFVLVVVCGPVFLIDTLDAMHGVPRELRHMMQSFRPTTLQYFFKLILPAILPTIFTSWKVNISLAIRVVTIAELVGAVTGIGHQLSVAQELFSVADVFAWTLVLVALLFLLEAVVARAEARILRWRTRAVPHPSKCAACARSSARPPPGKLSLRSIASILPLRHAKLWQSSARQAAASPRSSI